MRMNSAQRAGIEAAHRMFEIRSASLHDLASAIIESAQRYCRCYEQHVEALRIARIEHERILAGSRALTLDTAIKARRRADG